MYRPRNAYPDRTTLLATTTNSTLLTQPATAPESQWRRFLWLNPDRQEFVIHHDRDTIEQRSYVNNYRLISRR